VEKLGWRRRGEGGRAKHLREAKEAMEAVLFEVEQGSKEERRVRNVK